ncbi:hypothetical protein Tco_1329252 [Tanacetum coccineum]
MKEMKARLNFEGCSRRSSKIQEVSQHSESRTPNLRGEHRRRRRGKRCLQGWEERKKAYSIGWEVKEEVCPHARVTPKHNDTGTPKWKRKSVTKVPVQEKRNTFPENVTTKGRPHRERKLSRKVKIAEEDTGSQDRKNKSQAMKNTTYPNHGCAKKRIPSHPAFLANFLQQKKCIKDPVEIHHIKKREVESIENFVQRFKSESRHVKGAPECMRISGFMHGITNPKLIKRLHENILKSVDEIMRATTAFLRGEVVASNQVRKKTLLAWKQHETERKQNFNKRGDFRNQQRAGKLPHVIKELKLGSGKDQPKASKKGEASEKDKALEILMVQPWQRVARQRVTQSFSPDPEISSYPYGQKAL